MEAIVDEVEVAGFSARPFSGVLADKKPGIYLLHFPHDGMAYLGQAVNMFTRITRHLGLTSFPCSHQLMRKIKEVGPDGVKAYVLETVSDSTHGHELRDTLYEMELACWKKAKRNLGSLLLYLNKPAKSGLGFASRPVARVNVATGVVEEVYGSAQEAARSAGLTTGKAISDCCAGMRSCGRKPYLNVCGWWWRYADTQTPPPAQPAVVGRAFPIAAKPRFERRKDRSVFRLTYPDGVTKYDSLEEAATQNETTVNTLIHRCLNTVKQGLNAGWRRDGWDGWEGVWCYAHSELGRAVGAMSHLQGGIYILYHEWKKGSTYNELPMLDLLRIQSLKNRGFISNVSALEKARFDKTDYIQVKDE